MLKLRMGFFKTKEPQKRKGVITEGDIAEDAGDN